MESYEISDNIGPGNPDTPERRGLSTLPAVVGLASVVEAVCGFSLVFGDEKTAYSWTIGMLLLVAMGAGCLFAAGLLRALKRQEEASDAVSLSLALFFLCSAAALFLVSFQFLRA
jgi:hypothetical protein